MFVCFFDFVAAPILWSLLQALDKGTVNVQWQPLTLQGAGLFHIAMGAVLGLAAYGRTQEKLGGANNGGIALPSNVGTTYTPPAPAAQPGGFGAPASFNGNTGFGAATSGPVNPAPSWGTTPTASGSFQSKPMPSVGKPANIGPVDDDYMPPRE